MRTWLCPKFIAILLTLWLAACAASTPSDPGGGSAEPATAERSKAQAEATRNVGEAYLAGGNLLAALRELIERLDAHEPRRPDGEA